MNEKKLLTASERIKLLNQEQKSAGAKIIQPIKQDFKIKGENEIKEEAKILSASERIKILKA